MKRRFAPRGAYLVGTLAIVLAIAGCASHWTIVKDELTRQNIAFVGQSKDTLLLSKGGPDLKDALTDGKEVWTYRQKKIGQPKGWISNAATIPDPSSSLVPSSAITWTETLVFVVDKQGAVSGLNVIVSE